MSDPWTVQESIESRNFISENCENGGEENKELQQGFEDNFSPDIPILTNCVSLPDSQQYLAILERKLNKIKRDAKFVEQLTKRREECLRDLLNDSLQIDREDDIALDAPVTSNDSTVQEIYRHIQPVQPVSVGETVHIVKFDQLEEQRVVNESPEPASR